MTVGRTRDGASRMKSYTLEYATSSSFSSPTIEIAPGNTLVDEGEGSVFGLALRHDRNPQGGPRGDCGLHPALIASDWLLQRNRCSTGAPFAADQTRWPNRPMGAPQPLWSGRSSGSPRSLCSSASSRTIRSGSPRFCRGGVSIPDAHATYSSKLGCALPGHDRTRASINPPYLGHSS